MTHHQSMAWRRYAAGVALAGLAVMAAGPGLARQASPGAGQGPAAGAALNAVAVVDAQLVLQKSLAAQSITRQLDAQREELTKAIAAQEEELRTSEQQLARQRLTLAPEEFDAKRRSFEQQVAEVRRKTQDRARKLDVSFNEAREKLLRTINDVVAEIAKERGALLVIRRDTILYQADASLDISETVLNRLNAKLPQVTVNLPD